jgi:hypothetical protein
MGSISAPLLAATSAALLALVLSNEDELWCPGLAALLLVGATLLFIACVQLTFWAKRFVITPAELESWWPHQTEERDAELEWEQRFHLRRHAVWASRARLAYNGAILLLLASLPVMLMPAQGSLSGVRLAALLLAVLGLVAEAAWVVLASFLPGVFDPVDDE